MLAEGVRGASDVAALASGEPNRGAVMVWHYHDDDAPGPDAEVDLSVAGLPAGSRKARVAHYRIDERHSNAYAAWKRMGSPIAPSREQYGALEEASQLALLEAPKEARAGGGTLALGFTLPRQAASLLVIEWEP
jgi:xylan 1,4-beta-xylosidase